MLRGKRQSSSAPSTLDACCCPAGSIPHMRVSALVMGTADAQAGRRVFTLGCDGSIYSWSADVPSSCDDPCRCDCEPRLNAPILLHPRPDVPPLGAPPP